MSGPMPAAELAQTSPLLYGLLFLVVIMGGYIIHRDREDRRERKDNRERDDKREERSSKVIEDNTAQQARTNVVLDRIEQRL